MKKKPLFLGVTALAVAFPVLAIASPVEIPNGFDEGDIISADAFNENFDAIADAVNDNDARITALEGAGLPSGAIAFFPVIDDTTVDGCPPGWTEYADLRGRVPVGLAENGTVAMTVGTALAEEGTRTINEVVAHTHPDTFSIASSGAHTHTTNTDGSHAHSLSTGDNDAFYATASVQGVAGEDDNLVDAIGTANSAHSHFIPSSGSHGHTIDGSVQSTGSTSVDVTMPYIQLLACVKQ